MLVQKCNAPGTQTPIPVDQAADHFFGMVLVNDWSARDIQRWEYQPLGPFLAKNMATSISPWVVSLDALEPFRCAAPPQDPAPLSYLDHAGDQAYDINLEVLLQSESMTEPMSIARSNFKYMYWHIAQQLAHHTITGCNMRPGDLMASGTLSGPTPDTYGSMLEITWRGENPLELTTGETRKFLQDGDRLTGMAHDVAGFGVSLRLLMQSLDGGHLLSRLGHLEPVADEHLPSVDPQHAGLDLLNNDDPQSRQPVQV